MQFDLSTLETSTLVFIGTLVFGLVLAAFVLSAGLVALALVGVGKLAWVLASNALLAVVHGINAGWDRLIRHTPAMDVAADFQPQASPSTGTYPRVI